MDFLKDLWNDKEYKAAVRHALVQDLIMFLIKLAFTAGVVIAILLAFTGCGNDTKRANPTLSNPNGTILTEETLVEDIIVEDWDSNVTYWEDVDES